MAPPPLSRRDIWTLAWPIMLANVTVPLLSLADVAVIGHTGAVTDLGAIALGALIFNFVYWGFGFLRMGTTGFAAQAAGQHDVLELRALFIRALSIAVVAGVLLIVAQSVIAKLALSLLQGGDAVEEITRHYLLIRIWGAPATLAIYACCGMLIGLGKSRQLLLVQVVLNGLNIGLDVYFAGYLGWGAAGIALGTALAEWSSLLLALYLVVQVLREQSGAGSGWWPGQQLRDLQRWKQIMLANRDILLRTLSMLFSFAWFTNQGAQFGTVMLAANHILLQFISFSAFFLDGFAHVAESLVGRALGAGRRHEFDQAVRRTSELALGTALALAVLFALLGELLIQGLTEQTAVQVAASQYLPWAALYILLSCAAFQFDGIFIGATRTRAMRNASLMATLLFLTLATGLVPGWGNHGLWLAFVLYVLLRALGLALYYPALRRSIGTGIR